MIDGLIYVNIEMKKAQIVWKTQIEKAFCVILLWPFYDKFRRVFWAVSKGYSLLIFPVGSTNQPMCDVIIGELHFTFGALIFARI